MSKITAGPPGCASGSPARQRQLECTSSARLSGTKVQLTGHAGPARPENPPQDGRNCPPLVRRWSRHAFGHRPSEDRRRSRPQGHGARRPPPPTRPLSQLAGHLPRHRAEAGRVAGAGHRRRSAASSWRREAAAQREHSRGAAGPRRPDRGLQRLRRPPRFAGDHGRRGGGSVRGAGHAPRWPRGLARNLRRPALHDRRRGTERADPRRHARLRHDARRPRAAHPATNAPGWPGWSGWTIRAWPRASSGRACSTAACATTCGYRRWSWPCWRCSLRLEFVVDGLGHVFRSPRQQRALQHAYDASWFSRLLVTIAIGVVLLAVLAVVVAITSRGIWRALGGEGLPSPWSSEGARTQGRRATAHALLTIEGENVLDVTREAIAGGATGVIVGGALVAELTHLDAGFFASPGASSEIVHEHRARFGLPPTYLHHRQASMIEVETGADLHIRLMQAEVDLPLATWGERLLTRDAVVKGRTKAADLHPELVASWPGGASWPPAPEVAADRIRVRRIRRIAATSLFVAGLIDLLSAVTAPVRDHLHLISQFLPIEVARAAGALVAISGIAMIMLSRGVLKGQRRSWLVAVARLGRLPRPPHPPRRRRDQPVGVRRCPDLAHRPTRPVPGPGRTGNRAVRLLDPGHRWADRHLRRAHRGRGGRPGPPSPASPVAPGSARLGRTAHRRARMCTFRPISTASPPRACSPWASR